MPARLASVALWLLCACQAEREMIYDAAVYAGELSSDWAFISDAIATTYSCSFPYIC